MSSRTVARSKRVQYAALPYRPTGSSGTEVMLVTSRGRQRWIIPKGWPHSGRAPCDSAAREAFEEAGVLGLVGRRSLGLFRYKKRLKKGRVAVCDVHVFPLHVARQRPQWPEKNQREIKWVSVQEAAKRCRMLASGRSYVAGRGRLPLLNGGFGLQPLRGRCLDTVDQSGLCSRERGNDFR